MGSASGRRQNLSHTICIVYDMLSSFMATSEMTVTKPNCPTEAQDIRSPSLAHTPMPPVHRGAPIRERTGPPPEDPAFDRHGPVPSTLSLRPSGVSQQIRQRRLLADAVAAVVGRRSTIEVAIAQLGLCKLDAEAARHRLADALRTLGPHNFARFGLSDTQVHSWIADGRPQ